MGSTAGRCGSVRKDHRQGSYFIVVDVAAVGAEKRRQVRRRGFATERAARVALTQLLAELDGGSYVRPDPGVTVAGYAMANWLPALKVRGRRPSTLESYERNLRVHVFPRIGRRPIADVQPAELDQLYVELLAGARGRRPLAPRSVRYIHTILHGVFRHAMLKGFAAANPCLRADAPEPRTCRSREMNTWTAAQLHEFLAGLPQDYVRAGLFVLATTGMRRGEALGLQWTDVDLDAGELVVRRTLSSVDDGLVVGAPKTDRGRRTVALDAATVAVLREHRLAQRQDRLRLGPAYADDGWVFALADGRPVHPNRFMHAFGRRVTASGLPRIRLHDLRHTWATLALAARVHPKIVQERLGHASVAITLDIYTHVDRVQHRAAAEAVTAQFWS